MSDKDQVLKEFRDWFTKEELKNIPEDKLMTLAEMVWDKGYEAGRKDEYIEIMHNAKI